LGEKEEDEEEEEKAKEELFQAEEQHVLGLSDRIVQ
jgi:hypothetical protein